METQSPEGEIDITPHRRVSQTLLNSRTKIFLVEELREHGIENYKEIFEQYMTFNTYVEEEDEALKSGMASAAPLVEKTAP
uniref:Uncharacterized protein n=1 Tax=Sphaerodactylus townsendi TaxID=933632 RepID=A0ACB8F799_9SAUR